MSVEKKQKQKRTRADFRLRPTFLPTATLLSSHTKVDIATTPISPGRKGKRPLLFEGSTSEVSFFPRRRRESLALFLFAR